MGTWAVVDGFIYGKGVTARCRVKVSDQSGMRRLFSMSLFSDIAPSFPDGVYEIRFLDQSAFVRRACGEWSEDMPYGLSQSVLSPSD